MHKCKIISAYFLKFQKKCTCFKLTLVWYLKLISKEKDFSKLFVKELTEHKIFPSKVFSNNESRICKFIVIRDRYLQTSYKEECNIFLKKIKEISKVN